MGFSSTEVDFSDDYEDIASVPTVFIFYSGKKSAAGSSIGTKLRRQYQ